MTLSNPYFNGSWNLFRVMQVWLQTSLALSLFLIGAPLAMATEEPSYRVTLQAEPFEIREYAPLIVAQVEVPGDLSEASSAGFRLIANYIFGNNIAVRDGGVNMAEPVPEKIAMTIPVIAEGKGDKKTLAHPVCHAKAVHLRYPAEAKQSPGEVTCYGISKNCGDSVYGICE